MQNSNYFQVVKTVSRESEAKRLIDTGEVQFVLSIPEQFSRRLVRGEQPTLLLTADATDPAATSNALTAFRIRITSYNVCYTKLLRTGAYSRFLISSG